MRRAPCALIPVQISVVLDSYAHRFVSQKFVGLLVCKSLGHKIYAKTHNHSLFTTYYLAVTFSFQRLHKRFFNQHTKIPLVDGIFAYPVFRKE